MERTEKVICTKCGKVVEVTRRALARLWFLAEKGKNLEDLCHSERGLLNTNWNEGDTK